MVGQLVYMIHDLTDYQESIITFNEANRCF